MSGFVIIAGVVFVSGVAAVLWAMLTSINHLSGDGNSPTDMTEEDWTDFRAFQERRNPKPKEDADGS